MVQTRFHIFQEQRSQKTTLNAPNAIWSGWRLASIAVGSLRRLTAWQVLQFDCERAEIRLQESLGCLKMFADLA